MWTISRCVLGEGWGAYMDSKGELDDRARLNSGVGRSGMKSSDDQCTLSAERLVG